MLNKTVKNILTVLSLIIISFGVFSGCADPYAKLKVTTNVSTVNFTLSESDDTLNTFEIVATVSGASGSISKGVVVSINPSTAASVVGTPVLYDSSTRITIKANSNAPGTSEIRVMTEEGAKFCTVRLNTVLEVSGISYSSVVSPYILRGQNVNITSILEAQNILFTPAGTNQREVTYSIVNTLERPYNTQYATIDSQNNLRVNLRPENGIISVRVISIANSAVYRDINIYVIEPIDEEDIAFEDLSLNALQELTLIKNSDQNPMVLKTVIVTNEQYFVTYRTNNAQIAEVNKVLSDTSGKTFAVTGAGLGIVNIYADVTVKISGQATEQVISKSFSVTVVDELKSIEISSNSLNTDNSLFIYNSESYYNLAGSPLKITLDPITAYNSSVKLSLSSTLAEFKFRLSNGSEITDYNNVPVTNGILNLYIAHEITSIDIEENPSVLNDVTLTISSAVNSSILTEIELLPRTGITNIFVKEHLIDDSIGDILSSISLENNQTKTVIIQVNPADAEIIEETNKNISINIGNTNIVESAWITRYSDINDNIAILNITAKNEGATTIELLSKNGRSVNLTVNVYNPINYIYANLQTVSGQIVESDLSTATSNDYDALELPTATAKVSIRSILLSLININPSNATLSQFNDGKFYKFSTKDIEGVSVATISATGEIMALSNGIAQIEISVKDFTGVTFTCSFLIEVYTPISYASLNIGGVEKYIVELFDANSIGYFNDNASYTTISFVINPFNASVITDNEPIKWSIEGNSNNYTYAVSNNAYIENSTTNYYITWEELANGQIKVYAKLPSTESSKTITIIGSIQTGDVRNPVISKKAEIIIKKPQMISDIAFDDMYLLGSGTENTIPMLYYSALDSNYSFKASALPGSAYNNKLLFAYYQEDYSPAENSLLQAVVNVRKLNSKLIVSQNVGVALIYAIPQDRIKVLSFAEYSETTYPNSLTYLQYITQYISAYDGTSNTYNPYFVSYENSTYYLTDEFGNKIFKFDIDYSSKFVVDVADGLTETTAFKVFNANDLSNIKNNLSAYYVLATSLNLSQFTNWEPIGTNATPFTGSFDCTLNYFGNSYTSDIILGNITINTAGFENIGMFGYLDSTAKIKNLSILIQNLNVVATANAVNAGIIAGYNNGEISNCSVQATLDTFASNYVGTVSVGMLVGTNNGIIDNCTARGTLYVQDSTLTVLYTGGLVGLNTDNGSITGSKGAYSENSGDAFYGSSDADVAVDILTDTINGTLYKINNVTSTVGGAVGYNKGRIDSIIVMSTVFGNDNVGGLAGISKKTDEVTENIRGIINCFANVFVRGNNNLGGLIGHNINGLVEYSYVENYNANSIAVGTTSAVNATALIIGGSQLGGLIGFSTGGQIRYCYGTQMSSSMSYITETDGTYYGDVIENKNYSDIIIGGLIGTLWSDENTILENSYSTMNIQSFSASTKVYAGGIVGVLNGSFTNSQPVITNVYSRGNVFTNTTSITSYMGGIVGYIYISSTAQQIADSYSTSYLMASATFTATYMGGIIGRTSAPSTVFTDVFYLNTITSGNAYGTPKASIELKDIDTFVNWEFASFNGEDYISGYWLMPESADINSGYPVLYMASESGGGVMYAESPTAINVLVNDTPESEIYEKYSDSEVILYYYSKRVDASKNKYDLDDLITTTLTPLSARNILSVISSNVNIVKVNKNGTLEVLSEGNVTITIASVYNTLIYDTFEICAVKPVGELKLYKTNSYMMAFASVDQTLQQVTVEKGKNFEIFPKIAGDSTSAIVTYLITDTAGIVTFVNESIVTLPSGIQTEVLITRDIYGKIILKGNHAGVSTVTAFIKYPVVFGGITYYIESDYTLAFEIKVTEGATDLYSLLSTQSTTQHYSVTSNIYMRTDLETDKLAITYSAVNAEENEDSDILRNIITTYDLENSITEDISPLTDNDLFSRIINAELISEVFDENAKLISYEYKFSIKEEYRIYITETLNIAVNLQAYFVEALQNINYTNINTSFTLIINPQNPLNINLQYYSRGETDINGNVNINETTSNLIISGRIGILKIALFPYYSNVDYLEITSDNSPSGVSLFEQRLYNETTKLYEELGSTVTITNGIRLEKISLTDWTFNGMLYVRVLIPSNVKSAENYNIIVKAYTLNDCDEYAVSSQASINLETLKSAEMSFAVGTSSNIVTTEYVALGSTTDIYFNIRDFSLAHTITTNFVNGGAGETVSLTAVDEVAGLYRVTVGASQNLLGKVITITAQAHQVVDGEIIIEETTLDLIIVLYTINSIEIKIGSNIINPDDTIEIIAGQSYKLEVNILASYSADNSLYATQCIEAFEEELAKNYNIWKIWQIDDLTQATMYYSINESGITYAPNPESEESVESNSTFQITSNADGYYYFLGIQPVLNKQAGIFAELNIVYGEGGLPELSSIAQKTYTSSILPVVKPNQDAVPTPIYDAGDFSTMQAGVSYALVNDIYLTDWEPLTTAIASLDGMGHTIFIGSFDLTGFIAESNVTLGLFSYITDATILKNISIALDGRLTVLDNGIYVQKGNNITAFEDALEASNVTNGVIGANLYALSYQPTNTLTIDATAFNDVTFGILVGENRGGIITNCEIIEYTAQSSGTTQNLSGSSSSSQNNSIVTVTRTTVDGVTNSYVLKIHGSDWIDNVSTGITLNTTHRGSSQTASTNAIISGGLVGINSSSISGTVGVVTNSRVECTISASGTLGGFIGENRGIVSSSYYLGGDITNTAILATGTLTGGFVGRNNGTINTSYVCGDTSLMEIQYLSDEDETYSELKNSNLTETRATGSQIISYGTIGGFVHSNSGAVNNSYSNIKILGDELLEETETNPFAASRSAGFVYSNSGIIEECYTNSKMITNNFAHTPFTGTTLDNTFNNTGTITNSYFLRGDIINGSESNHYVANSGDGENTTPDPATGLYYDAFISASIYTTYAIDTFETVTYSTQNTEGVVDTVSTSEIPQGVWTMEVLRTETGDPLVGLYSDKTIAAIPQLVEANVTTLSVASYTEINSAFYYDYTGPKLGEYEVKNTYIEDENGNYILDEETGIYSLATDGNGDYALKTEHIVNPILVKTAEEFNNKINEATNSNTKVFDKIVRFIADISFNSTDLSVDTANVIFKGQIEGNGMTISQVRINSGIFGTGSSDLYDNLGMFAGVQSTYDTNNNLVKRAIIQNLNINVVDVSGTNVRRVGILAGQIIDAYIYNINLLGEGVVVQGYNMVGGLAGEILGDSRIVNISSNLSVHAGFQCTSYTPTDVDGYDSTILSYHYIASDSEDYSSNIKYISYAGSIAGIINLSNLETAYVRNINANGKVKILAEFAGGTVGYIGINTEVYNAYFTLMTASTQNSTVPQFIRGIKVTGGIVAENLGNIDYSWIAYSDADQILVDANSSLDAKYLFGGSTSSYSGVSYYAGGLVGINYGTEESGEIVTGKLTRSYARAKVSDLGIANGQGEYARGVKIAGGLIGYMLGGKLENVYATGSVRAIFAVGGLIGHLDAFISSIIGEEQVTVPVKTVIKYAVAANNWVTTDFNTDYARSQYNVDAEETALKLGGLIGSLQDYAENNLTAFTGTVASNNNYFVATTATLREIGSNSTITDPPYMEYADKLISDSQLLSTMKSTSASGAFGEWYTNDWSKTNRSYPILVANNSVSTILKSTAEFVNALITHYASNYDKQFEIGVDIDLTDIAFASIGTNTIPFKGTLKGASTVGGIVKVISGVSLTGSNLGLFNYTMGAKLADFELALLDVNIELSTKSKMGTVVANANLTTISNVSVTMATDATFTVTGGDKNYVGGLVGYSTLGRYESCSLTLTMAVSGARYVGGLIGYSYKDYYIDSSRVVSTGTGNLIDYEITSNIDCYIGGWVGNIDNSYNTVSGGSPLPDSNVNSTGSISIICRMDYQKTVYVGGIVGNNNASHLKDLSSNCKIVYTNTGEASGSSLYLGGIVGKSNGKIENSYNRYNDDILLIDENAIDILIRKGLKNNIYVGGLAGYSEYANIQGCSTNTNVNIDLQSSFSDISNLNINYIGGLLGYNLGLGAGDDIVENARLDSNYSSGKINALTENSMVYAGGLIGINHKGMIFAGSARFNNVAENAVTVYALMGSVGGLIGQSLGSVISSYSVGNVEFNNSTIDDLPQTTTENLYAGGLVGNTITSETSEKIFTYNKENTSFTITGNNVDIVSVNVTLNSAICKFDYNILDNTINFVDLSEDDLNDYIVTLEYTLSSMVESCSASGNVSLKGTVDSSGKGAYTVNGLFAGGLVGYAGDSIIDSYASGNIIIDKVNDTTDSTVKLSNLKTNISGIFAGGLAGAMYGDITESHYSGINSILAVGAVNSTDETITSETVGVFVGGLAGLVQSKIISEYDIKKLSGKISDSYVLLSSGSISATNNCVSATNNLGKAYTGGLVGKYISAYNNITVIDVNKLLEIVSSFAKLNTIIVQAQNKVFIGGLAGEFATNYVDAFWISTCFARINTITATFNSISGEAYAGGLIGNSSATISKAYFAGNVSYYADIDIVGNSDYKYSGGLIGYSTNDDISFTYALLTDVLSSEGIIIGGAPVGTVANTNNNLAVTVTGTTTYGGVKVGIDILENAGTMSGIPYNYNFDSVWTNSVLLGVITSTYKTPILIVFGVENQR